MSKQKEPYIALDMSKVLGNKNKLLSLWHLMRGYHFHYFVSTIFLALAAFARTGMYIFLGSFIDRMMNEGLMGRELTLSALGFGALIALQALSSFMSSWMANFTAENTTRRLRDYLFDHIQRLSYSYHSESKTGDLLERATSDVDTLRRFFAEQAISIGRIVMIFIISFVAIARINLRLALVSIIIIPIVLVISIIFFKRLSKAYEAYQEQGAILTTDLQENLSGVRVVKAFARQNYEIEKFDKENAEKFRLGRKFNWMHALFWPLSDIICSAQNIGSSFYGATMVLNGVMTLGQYLSFIGLLGWLIWPIRNLGRLIIDTSRALVSFGRISVVLEAPEEDMKSATYQPKDGIKGQITFEHVSFAYEKDFLVLDDVSFSCDAGQVVALLGSTGSGKTSLVNLLPRFYDVTSGQILLDGVNLNEYSREFLRSQIGIVEQEPFLFSCSIRDNITYGVHREVSQEEIEEAAREAAIHDVILGFKHGYDTLVGERGVTLSGGQKQRIAIARTLLLNPRILILDDSTSSVDMETEVEIRAALDRLMTNRTTFIIAHRIQSIMNADLILVFDKGKIIQMGEHEVLLNQAGIYKDIYDIQARIDSALQEEIEHVESI
ncbi:MAG TPA: ABC transporter ATP-binding protein [Anaerolineaceae bacterium]|nr:ABC transporter ATP-binding protein [Anaerolineaceae bacterium]HQJ32997.1 ABC transporter ATP-binding protein [Anaerolineaceae bacterium]